MIRDVTVCLVEILRYFCKLPNDFVEFRDEIHPVNRDRKILFFASNFIFTLSKCLKHLAYDDVTMCAFLRDANGLNFTAVLASG